MQWPSGCRVMMEFELCALYGMQQERFLHQGLWGGRPAKQSQLTGLQ